MIEQALRRFCESKHRKLIVTGVTFVVGLLLVMPLVDSIRAGGDEKDALLTELDSAQNVASELSAFERRVNEKLAEFKSLDARTVDDSSLPKLRSQLIDFAKDTCSIRKISVGPVSSRVWQPGQNPLSTGTDKKPADATSNCMLEWRPINLSLSGSSAALRNMLEKLAGSGKVIEIKRPGRDPPHPETELLAGDMGNL